MHKKTNCCQKSFHFAAHTVMILAYTKGALQQIETDVEHGLKVTWRCVPRITIQQSVTTADFMDIMILQGQESGVLQTTLYLKECSCHFHFLHAKGAQGLKPTTIFRHWWRQSMRSTLFANQVHLLTEIMGILYIVQERKGMKYIFKLL